VLHPIEPRAHMLAIVHPAFGSTARPRLRRAKEARRKRGAGADEMHVSRIGDRGVKTSFVVPSLIHACLAHLGQGRVDAVCSICLEPSLHWKEHPMVNAETSLWKAAVRAFAIWLAMAVPTSAEVRLVNAGAIRIPPNASSGSS
jgi:hypothetical protein